MIATASPDGDDSLTGEAYYRYFIAAKFSEEIRFSEDGGVNIVWDLENDEPARMPTQEDMDTLPVGRDLTDEEIELLDY